MAIWLMNSRTPLADFPVTVSCIKLALAREDGHTRQWSVSINLLLWRTAHGFHPVAPNWVHSILFLIIGDSCAESNGTVQMLLHMPNHMLQLFQMPFMWHHTEMTKRHDPLSNVKLAQCDQPLSSTNQSLEVFNAVRAKQGSVI